MERAYRAFIRKPRRRGLLWLLSLIYGAVIDLRNYLFDSGLLSSVKPKENPYIISIGNISAGGSGKTPVTLALAKKYSTNAKVAVILRGYRGTHSSTTPKLVKEGNTWLMQPPECGDEAYLLASKLHDVDVIICKDRRKAAEMAAQRGAKVILMDDGFQHRWLKRDLDIVILDGSLRPAELHVFPNGILRESFASLARADLVLINKCTSEQRQNELRSLARQYTDAPIQIIEPQVTSVYDAASLESVNLTDEKVSILCGIANPEHFIRTVTSLQAEMVNTYSANDHSSYSKPILEKIVREARQANARYIVCTEKDAIKLTDWNFDLPLVVVAIEVNKIDFELTK